MTHSLSRLLRAFGMAVLMVVLAVTMFGPTFQVEGFVGGCYVLANALIFASVVTDPTRGGVSLIWSFFFLFFVAIPAAVQISSGVFPFGGSYTSANLLAAYGVLSLAQLAAAAGDAFSTRTRGERADPTIAHTVSEPRLRRAIAVCVLLSAGIATYLGFGYLRLDRAEFDLTQSATGLRPQLLFAGRSISLFAAAAAIYVVSRSPSARKTTSFVLMACGACLIFALYHSPTALPRFIFLGAAMTLVAVCFSLFAFRSKALFALGAPVFLVVLFPALKVLGSGDGRGLGEALQTETSRYLVSVDFDAFKQIVDTLVFLDDGSLRYGTNFLGVLFFWVPRSLWSGKPSPSGEMVSQNLGYAYTNVSSPLPAEALLAFGYGGVVFLFLVFGWFLRRIELAAFDDIGRMRRRVRPEVLIYALTTGFLTIVLRGSLNGVAPMFACGFACAFIVIWYATRGQSGLSERADRLHASTRTGRRGQW